MDSKYIISRPLNEGSKSILHLYFDVANITCEKLPGIATNADSTRNLIGYSGTFKTCFLSRQKNMYSGFTWDRKTHECFGIENALDINDDYECCESCIFNGKLLFAKPHSLSCKTYKRFVMRQTSFILFYRL